MRYQDWFSCLPEGALYIKGAYHTTTQDEAWPKPAKSVGCRLETAADILPAPHKQHGRHVEDNCQAGLVENHRPHKHKQRQHQLPCSTLHLDI